MMTRVHVRRLALSRKEGVSIDGAGRMCRAGVLVALNPENTVTSIAALETNGRVYHCFSLYLVDMGSLVPLASVPKLQPVSLHPKKGEYSTDSLVTGPVEYVEGATEKRTPDTYLQQKGVQGQEAH